MAEDYVSVYRRLLEKWTSGAKPRQLDFNGSDGLVPVYQRQGRRGSRDQSEDRV